MEQMIFAETFPDADVFDGVLSDKENDSVVGPEASERNGTINKSSNKSVDKQRSIPVAAASFTAKDDKSQQLSNELAAAYREIDLLKSQNARSDQELRRAVHRFDSQIKDMQTKLGAKDHTIRLLEKDVVKKNGTIAILRKKVKELQVLAKNDVDDKQQKKEEQKSSVSTSSSDGRAMPSSATTCPARSIDASGNGLNQSLGFSALGSLLSPFKSPTTATMASPVQSSSPFTVTRSPDRKLTPPRNGISSEKTISRKNTTTKAQISSSRNGTSANTIMRSPPRLPNNRASTSSTSIRAMNLTPLHLTPLSKAEFLLQEQKKTIESLTRSFVGERERNNYLEKKVQIYEECTENTERSMEHMEILQCNSDEFDHDMRAEQQGDNIMHGTAEKARKGPKEEEEEEESDEFLRKLDSLEVDLSTEFINLSNVYES